MDKKQIKHVVITLVILGIFVCLFFSYLPKIKEMQIKNEIESASYCSVDSDCVDAGGKCPFGCQIYVNKNEVSRIASLVENFDGVKCEYGCIGNVSPVCSSGKCTFKIN